MSAQEPNIREIAREAAGRLIHTHELKPGSAIIGLPVLYPDGERVTVYISSDRPGLIFVSDFEGGRKRAMMAGVREAFDRIISGMRHDPPLVSEGLGIYVRVPPEKLDEAIIFIANASAGALREALCKTRGAQPFSG